MKKVKLSGPGMQVGHVNEIGEIYMDISHAELNIKRTTSNVSIKYLVNTTEHIFIINFQVSLWWTLTALWNQCTL